jgi:glycerophosphoryl diester phosphodiesterase
LVLEVCRGVASDIPRLVSLNAASANRLGGLESFLSRASDLVELVAVNHKYLEANWDAITAILSADRVGVWTLNDEASIGTWLDRGVGHITSDRPDLVLALRAEPPGRFLPPRTTEAGKSRVMPQILGADMGER